MARGVSSTNRKARRRAFLAVRAEDELVVAQVVLNVGRKSLAELEKILVVGRGFQTGGGVERRHRTMPPATLVADRGSVEVFSGAIEPRHVSELLILAAHRSDYVLLPPIHEAIENINSTNTRLRRCRHETPLS